MSTPEFVAGQRWISATEPELGLGVVQNVESRRVDIAFPAADETRIYALGNTPLSRVEYATGDRVQSRDGKSFTVIDRMQNGGNFIYLCVDENEETIALPEIELDAAAQFSKPQDRLFAGQMDSNAQFELRVETLLYQHRQLQSEVFGLTGPRVQILPHQFYIAAEVSRRFAPRVLLADEVGLGKTIEAGLIVHQQLLSGQISRVLIIVPDTLIHQWLVEMLRRFNLSFTILDEDRCRALVESGEPNAFAAAQLVLCPLSLFVENPNRVTEALATTWDMLVVDEAHHLQWSPDASSPAYRSVEQLARQTPALLLLTATPEQLGNDGHFARLRLLDPDRYHNIEQFRAEEAHYREIGDLVDRLLASDIATTLQGDTDLGRKLSARLGPECLDHPDDEPAEHTAKRLIRELLDRHGTGRVLFRNTRETVGGFAKRNLQTYPLAAPAVYAGQLSSTDVSRQLYPELAAPEDWVSNDPRALWLGAWLEGNRDRKTLVICSAAETARELELWLRLRGGFRSAVFHEELTLVARDRAAAYFADTEQGAQTLICSEIGSEGRNFQFAHDLVLFDLPRNPDLLEQRIGRLDRIGQTETINIHLPYLEASAQSVLLRWYHEGINAFETTAPAGEQLLSQFKDELELCLLERDPERIESLLGATRQHAAELKRLLDEGRNRLLEHHSFNREVADTITQGVAGGAYRLELSDYLERLLDQFGIEHQPITNQSLLIRPSDHMMLPSFPGLPEDGISATFDRALALTRDDLEFLTWEHPLVTNALELLIGGDYGNNALCTLKLPGVAAGTLLVELVYAVSCPAPKALQLQRYIPQGLLRVLLDGKGNDLSEVCPREEFQRLVERVGKRTAREVVKHARGDLQRMIERGEAHAERARAELIGQASETLAQARHSELERLVALARVNPNIREAELTHLRRTSDEMSAALQNTRMRLDAIRVGVVT